MELASPLTACTLKQARISNRNMVGGETDESKSSRVFEDDKLAEAQEGAKACPVSAIAVTQM